MSSGQVVLRPHFRKRNNPTRISYMQGTLLFNITYTIQIREQWNTNKYQVFISSSGSTALYFIEYKSIKTINVKIGHKCV